MIVTAHDTGIVKFSFLLMMMMMMMMMMIMMCDCLFNFTVKASPDWTKQ